MAFRGRNAQSGIGVSEHCKNTFTELQRKKLHRYVVFMIDEKKKEVVEEKTGERTETYYEKKKEVEKTGKRTETYYEKKKEVVVEKIGERTETYDDFLESLPENDCRYAVYDYDFVNSENCQKSKIFFIAWSPSVSRIRSKMLYATSKDRFRRELEGIHYEIQATDPSEVDLETLQERAK